MKTQRFNTELEWRNYWPPNQAMYGMFQMLEYLEQNIYFEGHTEMIEIGSYMGESATMFASSNLFNTVTCIEPFEGEEEFNDIYGYNWDFVRDEFKTNIRYFDNIVLHEEFSYDISHIFKNESQDFIYIDANHSYEDIKKDIELYLPKVKKGGYIGGHDYIPHFSGVIKAVNEMLGEPDEIFRDHSWIKKRDWE